MADGLLISYERQKQKVFTDMDTKELKSTHSEYDKNVNEWEKFKAAYSGTKALIDYGVLKQNTREEDRAYKYRKESAYGFNYSARIINIINSYIFQKPGSNDYGALANDALFKMFLDNADINGVSFSNVVNDLQRWASIYGHIGILIDKPIIEGRRTVSQDLQDGIYPFITSYTPLNILDWTYDRINGRSVLSYIKLLDDDGNYRLWWRDSWEVWELVKDKPVMISRGINPLNEIPFVFMINETTEVRNIGKSDIQEISRMDIAILRLLSGSEEIFNLASFPMLMKPYLPPNAVDDSVVGVGNVIEFDPKNPNSKPEWLKTEVAEPIQSITEWIKGIIEEIYKSIHASGLNSGSQVKSGEALTKEFSALNAFLAKKSKNTVIKTESQVIYYWLKWQGKSELFSGVNIDRPLDFDTSSLSNELDNLSVARVMVKSDTYQNLLQKMIARKTIPTITPDNEAIINKEIDEDKVNIDLNAQDNGMDAGSQ